MFLELQGMKTKVMVNTDNVVFIEPSPAGTSTNLVLVGGLAIQINEHYDIVSAQLEHGY